MKVSVLLTCYNHVDYLQAAWDGIQQQTHRDIEIIALDDGSTDGTRELLSSLASDFPLQVIFNEANLGTYGTLNRGLELANGDLIAVLNDDDVWLPNKLARQIELFQEFPRVGLAHTHGQFIDGEGKVFEGSPLGFTFPRTRTGDVLLDLVYANKIIASAAVFRRSAIPEGGFNADYFGSGDWEMWFRIALNWEVGFVDEPLTQYRVHGANASHKLDRIWRDDQMLREWMIPLIQDLEGRFPESDIRRAQAHNWACLGTVRTLNGNPTEGRKAYAESIRLTPARWKSWLRWAATFLPPNVFRKLI